MTQQQTLDQRIARTLSNPSDLPSGTLEALVKGVEAAANAADVDATQARERALDPASVVDPVKVGAQIAAATITRDRLQAAIPRIQALLKDARAREYAAAWEIDAAATQARVDAAAVKLNDRFPRLIAEMTELLAMIKALDAEVDQIRSARPENHHFPIEKVEHRARGDRVPYGKELRLPEWMPEHGQYPWAWPEFVLPLGVQMAQMYRPPPFNPDWHAAIDERIVKDVATAVHTAQIYESNATERLERERVAANEAARRDRAAAAGAGNH